MTEVPPELRAARERFLALVDALRPELHRYCSRLVGSAIDGEDVVQDALAKAYYALSLSTELPPLRPWLLRIAHNTAIDFLRRYERRFVEPVAETPEPLDPTAQIGPDTVRAALSSFIGLPVLQRSCVILKDVLGHSSEDIAQIAGTTVPAVKSALVRGRAALRAQPRPDVVPWRDRPPTTPEERALLDRYVELFNARDWLGVQELLAEQCRLDLVAKASRRGKAQVSQYFGNYAADDVRLQIGHAEGRDVIAVSRPSQGPRPIYVITLDWLDGEVGLIRDYRYVPYLVDELDVTLQTEPT
jgi:RNA polymerase sigma factor (sigma-70 family)